MNHTFQQYGEVSYFECERADSVMLTFPDTVDKDLHLAINPSFFRPVQNTFLQQQQEHVKHKHFSLFCTKGKRLRRGAHHLVLLFQLGDHDDDG